MSKLIAVLALASSAQGFLSACPSVVAGRPALRVSPDATRDVSRSSVIVYHKSAPRPRDANGIPIYENSGMTAGGFGTGGDAPFQLRGFSLGDAIVGAGFLITVSSFTEYATGGGGGLGGLGFVYGLPVMLGGAALKYGEVLPVPVKASEEAQALFEKLKTPTMDKINSDVTRHRYGDEAHLDSTVMRLGLKLPQKEYPQLEYLEYGVAESGELEFTMVWHSQDTPFRVWAEAVRVKKYDTFFGPDVWSKVVKVNGPERLVGIKLTTGERPEEEVAEVPLGKWRMGCENVAASAPGPAAVPAPA